MHSLKNTIVAVGLLGLSFLFYQASSTPSAEKSELFTEGDTLKSLDSAFNTTNDDQPASVPPAATTGKPPTGLAPPQFKNQLDSGFGNSQPALGSNGTADSTNFGPPKIELPDVNIPGVKFPPADSVKAPAPGQSSNAATPSQPPTSFGAGQAAGQPEFKQPEIKPPFANEPFPKEPFPKESFSRGPAFGDAEKPADANNFAANQPSQFNQSIGNSTVTTPNQSMTREPLGSREARDEGLIAALQSSPQSNASPQPQPQPNSGTANNQPASPTGQAWQKNDFAAAGTASQPNSPVGFGGFPTTPKPAPNSSLSPNLNPSLPTQPAAGDAPFPSQPVSTGDSSFNQMASNLEPVDSIKRDVLRADSSAVNSSFQAVWPQVDRLVEGEDFLGALRLLSGYYRNTDLTGPQRQRLMAFLDGLAGKVIFSQEHHLDGTPYTVANESLNDVATRWQVPAQLIYNINRSSIANPAALQPGTELKQVRGPFDAEIDLTNNTMTLFLNGLYAGRYEVRMGISGQPKPGDYRVFVKAAEGHSWRDASGKAYGIGTPENGYGPFWIGLTGQLCIHAIPDSAQPGHHGCIGLAPQDAEDIFGILSKGSEVRIVR